MRNAEQVIEQEFLQVRAKILEIAAFLDRLAAAFLAIHEDEAEGDFPAFALDGVDGFQGGAAGGHLTQAHTQRDDEIGLAHARRQLGVDADAHIARIQRVKIVKRVLKAKGITDRQRPVFGKSLQRLRGLHCPTAATCDNQRSL